MYISIKRVNSNRVWAFWGSTWKQQDCPGRALLSLMLTSLRPALLPSRGHNSEPGELTGLGWWRPRSHLMVGARTPQAGPVDWDWNPSLWQSWAWRSYSHLSARPAHLWNEDRGCGVGRIKMNKCPRSPVSGSCQWWHPRILQKKWGALPQGKYKVASLGHLSSTKLTERGPE